MILLHRQRAYPVARMEGHLYLGWREYLYKGTLQKAVEYLSA